MKFFNKTIIVICLISVLVVSVYLNNSLDVEYEFTKSENSYGVTGRWGDGSIVSKINNKIDSIKLDHPKKI